ncbi:MAG: HNH endonuclease [Planctomycetes bacterium]|nr:HNH endonuclease [Planctomycetota bacterium]
MRCTFCKNNSSSSKSVEHIIPQSLGNTEHVLPPGVVCDGCNKYLFQNVEKPFLDSLFMRYRRFLMKVPSKKKRIPPIDAWHAQSRIKVNLFHNLDDKGISVGPAEGEDESKWIHSIMKDSSGTLYVPSGNLPDNNIVTRFIGKIGIEALASRVLNLEDWKTEIIDKPELDELRDHVRLGFPATPWPINYRRIYPTKHVFDDRSEAYQVLHEYDILVIEANEYLIIVAIFGDEYTLNLGGRCINGYERWLKENDGKSPL